LDEAMTRLLITGSRDWTDYEFIRERLVALSANHDYKLTIVEGGARGADWHAMCVATRYGWPVEEFPADWSKGRAAGIIRNQQMVDTMPDYCYAFIRNNSKGATHCANAAKKAGIPTVIFRMD
jgi:hypothetical protein